MSQTSLSLPSDCFLISDWLHITVQTFFKIWFNIFFKTPTKKVYIVRGMNATILILLKPNINYQSEIIACIIYIHTHSVRYTGGDKDR